MSPRMLRNQGPEVGGGVTDDEPAPTPPPQPRLPYTLVPCALLQLHPGGCLCSEGIAWEKPGGVTTQPSREMKPDIAASRSPSSHTPYY